jgi:hypothetical protein
MKDVDIEKISNQGGQNLHISFTLHDPFNTNEWRKGGKHGNMSYGLLGDKLKQWLQDQILKGS